jgi:hypothetical protein
MQVPKTSIQDPAFRYTTSARTDVTATWERFGYVPPDREKQRQEMLRLNPSIVEIKECPNTN